VASSDDVCVIMYTSGTTEQPKGAMLTHGNMLWNVINMLTVGPGLSRSDVTIAVAPLFHIGALGLSALPLLYVGGTVAVQQLFTPERMRELFAREKVTTQFMVPAMWAALTKVTDIGKYGLGSRRYLLWVARRARCR
jgi:fatty-acyl-CoA synthase